MSENFKQVFAFVFGTSAAVADILKLGTGVIGLFGALMMVLAGWELWQTRKIDRQIKQIELEKMLQPAPKEEL